MLEIINKDFDVNDKVLKHIAKRFNVKSISVDSHYCIYIMHKNGAKTTYFPQCDDMTRDDLNKYLLNRIRLAINNYWERYRLLSRFSRANRRKTFERTKNYYERCKSA